MEWINSVAFVATFLIGAGTAIFAITADWLARLDEAYRQNLEGIGNLSRAIDDLGFDPLHRVWLDDNVLILDSDVGLTVPGKMKIPEEGKPRWRWRRGKAGFNLFWPPTLSAYDYFPKGVPFLRHAKQLRQKTEAEAQRPEPTAETSKKLRRTILPLQMVFAGQLGLVGRSKRLHQFKRYAVLLIIIGVAIGSIAVGAFIGELASVLFPSPPSC